MDTLFQQQLADARAYAASCRSEQLDLLRALARLPAPTGQEERRARFCLDWLRTQGIPDARIDEAGNLIWLLNDAPDRPLAVFAAHTDIVFPDTEPLPLRESGGRLYAPGIGDDTANLVNLLLAARYLFRHSVPTRCGLLFAANVGEEGLGNLAGTKALFAAYGARIRAFTSFDLYAPLCCRDAVGSVRYRITCRTEGGHSYGDFGKPSAIRLLCALVCELYDIPLPTRARTTCNVGRIEGGTTVNSIAQEASLLYEFRSTAQDCLDEVEQKFRAVMARQSGKGGEFTVELLGLRPGSSPAMDAAQLERFTAQNAAVIRAVTGQEPEYTPCSTDSNIPLSLAVPANTIGTVRGGGAHTREEWVEADSLPEGLTLALGLMLQYKT